MYELKIRVLGMKFDHYTDAGETKQCEMGQGDLSFSLGGRVTLRVNFWDRIKPFSTTRRRRAIGSIHSLENFRVLLDRERARAERSGQEFSLVVFDASRQNGTAVACLRDLARELSSRVRATDEIGWFSDKSVGVFLPATSVDGAWIFADDVSARINRRIPSLERTVYTYPTKWIDAGSGSGDVRRPRVPAADSGTESSVMMHDGGRSIESLETVLTRPIPVWKRTLDIVGSIAALVVLSPVFLVVAAFIKIVSPGPVFYTQKRVGYLGKTFRFWKFRTMHVNNDASGHQNYLSSLIKGDAPMIKLDADRDPRIIRCGRILRQSCVDELPQLFNVLAGEMSLVGPRPCLPYEAEEYLAWHARRFDSVPGMTGLWQVNGKNKLTFKQMIRFDIQYARTMSPWLDVKIMLQTVPAIVGMVSEHLAGKREARTGSAVSASPKRV